MYLEDSEEDEIELIVKFVKSKKVTFDETQNQVYFINDQSYLIKRSQVTDKLKNLFSQKQ